MDNGQKMAIQILVARDLKIEVGYVTEAENLLETGNISPVLIGHFSKEAQNATKEILVRKLVDKAITTSEKYLQQYNIAS